MRALVLAGGLGTRLAPLTPYLPKPLAPVGNRPVLTWVLDHLDTAGVTEIGVTIPGGTTDLYRRVCGTRTIGGLPLTWLEEPDPVGSAGSLRDQRAFIGDEPVLVVPADIICPINLAELVNHHRQHPCEVTIVVSPRDMGTWDGDILVPHGDHTATYLFKPGPDAASNLGSTGTWVVAPTLLDRIRPQGFVDLSSDVLPHLGVGVFNAGEVYLRDIGTPANLLRGNLEAAQCAHMLDGTKSALTATDAMIERDVQLIGPVLLGTGAQVRNGARVHGPAVIGPGAVIGADAFVERALVLPGARVDDSGMAVDDVVGDGPGAMAAMLEYAAHA